MDDVSGWQCTDTEIAFAKHRASPGATLNYVIFAKDSEERAMISLRRIARIDATVWGRVPCVQQAASHQIDARVYWVRALIAMLS